MIQIGEQPFSPAFAEGRSRDPDQPPGGHLGHQGQLADDPFGDTAVGVLFVSPPPLPFPRVFPGL